MTRLDRPKPAPDSPLPDVIVGRCRSVRGDLSEDTAARLRSELTAYLLDEIDKEAIREVLWSATESMEPYDFLQDILTGPAEVPQTPERILIGDSRRAQPRPWTRAEDLRLLLGLHILGLHRWQAVSNFVGSGRSRAQCAQRWRRALDPAISKSKWTPEEEAKFIEAMRASRGRGWKEISRLMSGRSDLQCRFHAGRMHREHRLPPDLVDVAPPTASLLSGSGHLKSGRGEGDALPMPQPTSGWSWLGIVGATAISGWTARPPDPLRMWCPTVHELLNPA
jgi:hypothetical protein